MNRVQADTSKDIIDEMDDVDDILDDLWEGGDYVTALRRRRGSRTVSEASGVWSRSRRNSRANGFRRRSTREEEDPGPEPEDVLAAL